VRLATFPAPLLIQKGSDSIKGAASAIVKGRSSPADLNTERHRVRSCGTVPGLLPAHAVTRAARTAAANRRATAAELVQTQDKIIKSFPEVASVWGKAGRASTATDPAPTEMFETVINLKPKSDWRPGMTVDKLTPRRIAGRRHVGRIELERLSPRNQRLLRCTRLRECVERMHHHGTRQCG
jgi:hypothetical protein